MNIALVGKGKLNSAIRFLAERQGHRVTSIYDSTTRLTSMSFDSADIIFEATHRDAFLNNLEWLLVSKKPVIVGTTGWEKEFSTVRERVLRNGSGFLYASNFSLGVNLFFRLIREAGTLLSAFEQFDVSISEAHHIAKKDFPSGTALKMAQELVNAIPRKKRVISEPGMFEVNGTDQIMVSSVRMGDVIGDHSLNIDSEHDRIAVSHSAKSRTGFATGALLAAEWLGYGPKGRVGFYSFDNYLDDVLKNGLPPSDILDDVSFRR